MAGDIETRVMRKISWRIIPFIMLLYFIAFIDRWIKDMTGSFLGGLYFVAGLLALSAVLTIVLSRAGKTAAQS